jgi:hypothetical protein
MHRVASLCLAFALTAAISLDSSAQTPTDAWKTHGPLQVSDNHRFLVHKDGTPFFYLADTAWELFHRLNREEAALYLNDRASKGFTVVQAVALAELDGLNEPNPYGFRPLLENDPARPDVKEGPDNDYWDHVDFIVNKAEQLGLIIAMLPTWGDKWNKKWGVGPEVFTADNAHAYGKWLGERYKDKPIIWMLGGDRPIENDTHRAINRAMAEGLHDGDGGTHLKTLHTSGGSGSAQYFHAEPWLDFNVRQNGHADEFNGRYEITRTDYDRTPPKPVIDAEPIYEDHPVNFKASEHGHSVAADVRRAVYWDLFTGACGHTYGHHSVWQMYDPSNRKPVNNPLMSWKDALQQPGAGQMQFARRLIESRPFLTRIPADDVIVESPIRSAMPGAGTRRFVATRDLERTYAMVYVPVGRPVRVHLGALKAQELKAWWFDPRTGEAKAIGTFAASGEQDFVSPNPGELLDWVLVIDDTAQAYGAPGTRRWR